MTTTPAPRRRRGAAIRPLPQGRYGKSRPQKSGRSKRATWIFSILGLLVGVGIALLAYRNLGTAPIDAERRAFTEQPGDAMSITLDVTREDPGKAGVCIVRVRDLSGAESGRREVLIPPEQGTVEAVIKSVGKPVTADVFGCSYEVPNYLSTPVRPTE